MAGAEPRQTVERTGHDGVFLFERYHRWLRGLHANVPGKRDHSQAGIPECFPYRFAVAHFLWRSPGGAVGQREGPGGYSPMAAASWNRDRIPSLA